MAFEVFPASPGGKLRGGGRGNVVLHWLWNGYLTGLDKNGRPHPMLAQEVPSAERGTWKVNPDGTMETAWKLRPTAKWQDGRPIISRDFAFAWRVIVDPAVPVSGRAVESLISNIDTPDDATLVIHWRQPYFGALEISGDNLPPLPAHLLLDLYEADKQAFVNSDYWTSEYIGSGPFKVEQWDPANNVIVASANDGFALGRPKVDRLRLDFIADQQTMLTNVLAGGIDVVVSPAIRTPPSVTLKETWEAEGKGRVYFSPGLLFGHAFQLRDVSNAQPALRDKQVRKALAYAVDKQAIVDAMPTGVRFSAHYPMPLTDANYAVVDRAVPKYEFNPARADELLELAGWTRGSDGIRRSSNGARLDVPQMSSAGENELLITAIADYWRRVGVDSSIELVTAARALDAEFTTNFPGASYISIIPQWNRIDWVSWEMPTAATRYVGRNSGGYWTPRGDELVTIVQTTVAPAPREQAIVELMHIWMDDVGFLPVIYNPAVIAALKGISGYETEVWQPQQAHTWNIYQWSKE